VQVLTSAPAEFHPELSPFLARGASLFRERSATGVITASATRPAAGPKCQRSMVRPNLLPLPLPPVQVGNSNQTVSQEEQGNVGQALGVCGEQKIANLFAALGVQGALLALDKLQHAVVEGVAAKRSIELPFDLRQAPVALWRRFPVARGRIEQETPCLRLRYRSAVLAISFSSTFAPAEVRSLAI